MKILVNSLVALSSLLLSLLGYMYFLANRKNVKHHSFSVKKEHFEGKNLSVFFISDIHRRRIDDELLRKVVKEGPIDIVIIGGDLAEGSVPLLRIDQNVEKLSKLGQLVFIWGNNDREVGENAIRDIIYRHGGTILDNMNTSIKGHPEWGVCGTDDPSHKNVDIEAALKDTNQFQHLIVVTHTPLLFRKVEEYIVPDLQLAGHMHGGQIRVGKYGLHPLGKFTESDGKAKLISNGYGTSLVPLRLGAIPESHVIRIGY